MRRCALLVFVAVLALPAFAAKRISVEQLDQILTASHLKPDAETASRLLSLELSERSSPVTLSRWQAESSGPETRQALTLLADASAFLDLPPSELPSKAAPDFAEQRRIMALTITYVSKTLHQLPNFSATRITTSFQDQPEGYEKGGTVFSPAQPLAQAGTASATVFYRDGGEVVNAALEKGKKGEPFQGLSTSGEFGPILATTLLDAAHSKLAWGHWEQNEAGPVAVFDYAVPSEKSHYEVSYCCFGADTDFRPFHQIAGYHGEIAVDPANGPVLRVTAQADLKPTDPLVRADIMVEYGPVELGGRSYICPVKSISISQTQAADANMARSKVQFSPGHLQTLLNDVAFVQYHLFHADAHIMTAAEGVPEGHPDAAPPTNLSSADTSASSPPAASALPKASDNGHPLPPTVINSVSSPAPPPSSSETKIATTSLASEPPAASALAGPDFDVPSLSAHDQGQVPVFKANSEAVVVDIVVTKGHDEPVTGLRKEDFQVLEDAKPQPVNFFEEHTPDDVPAVPLPQMPPNVYTNQPDAPLGDSVTVLLLDSLNTPRQDQSYVHQQILNFFKTMQPGTRVAIFALGSKLRYVQGFTDDPSLLRAAVNDPKNGVKVDSTPASRTRQDDMDDADHIRTMEMMMNGHRDAGIDAVEKSLADLANYQMDQRVTMTLDALQHIARYLAGVPGRKNLIWFSSTFPITVFPSGKEKQLTPAQNTYGQAIRATADMLTLSKVAIYPVGAEGMMVDHPGEAENDLEQAGKGPILLENIHQGADARAANISAMEQLAADTGGEAIFNTNDLNKAIARVVQNGSHYYTLVYTPTDKDMNGKYRRIEVKLSGGNYKLSYRRGYYADQAAQDAPATDATISDEPNGQPDPLRSLLGRGMPSASQLLYGVRVLPASSQPAPAASRAGGNDKLTGHLTRYNVDFLIRWTDVDLQSTPQGTHRGQVQVDVIAYSRDGKPVNWVGVTQRMNINPATFAAIQRSGIPAHVEIDLPQQDLYLATGVYDWASQKAGTLEIPLNVLEAQAAATAPAASIKPN